MVSCDTRMLSSSGYCIFSHPEICSGDQTGQIWGDKSRIISRETGGVKEGLRIEWGLLAPLVSSRQCGLWHDSVACILATCQWPAKKIRICPLMDRYPLPLPLLCNSCGEVRRPKRENEAVIFSLSRDFRFHSAPHFRKVLRQLRNKGHQLARPGVCMRSKKETNRSCL
jgi:hypothetical protein